MLGSKHTCCSPQPVAYDMCCGTLGDVNKFYDFLSLFCFVYFINGVLVFQFAYQAGNFDVSPFTINYFCDTIISYILTFLFWKIKLKLYTN
jgi:hypothetical protein